MHSSRRTRKSPRVSGRRKGQKILLIHGHDEKNVLRLQKFILEHWKDCTLITLSDLPAQGRTIIEKFEWEAKDAVFALALMTPDDIVRNGNSRYRQARPNLHFELGWVYGRLGRSRVCILFKRGTKLPSDLEGINRFDFTKNVRDVFEQLQTELESAGMLKSA